MEHVSFNDGWKVRSRVTGYQEFIGATRPWTPVQLPHDAQISLTRGPEGTGHNAQFPGGSWEYEKTWFAPSELRGKPVILEFEGVSRRAAVTVNDEFAGHRPFGYVTFHVRIDPFLRYDADNVIRVDARVGTHDSRWYAGGGIYRNVKILIGEPVHVAVDGVVVTLRDVDDERAALQVATTIENDGAVTTGAVVSTEIIDDAGTVVVHDAARVTTYANAAETLRQELRVPQPRRWSLDSPTLYTCRTVVTADDGTTDTATTTFGIRTLQVDSEHGLRINGEVVDLRGACIHHDNGVIGAATIERADERRVELLKAAGFNAIRSAHNPCSKALLDACDRHGMLMMDELTDVWTSQKVESDYSTAFPDWWEADIEAMVRKDRNHPSVILYSIGNEIPQTSTPAGARWSRRLAEKVRSIDDTRFVTNGVNAVVSCRDQLVERMLELAERDRAEGDAPAVGDAGYGVVGSVDVMRMIGRYMSTVLQEDFVADLLEESYATLDVAGYNYTGPRYEMDHERFPNRVILGTETNPMQIAQLWQQVRDNPHVIGDFTWTGWDYMGEVGFGEVDDEGRNVPSYPALTFGSGDLDLTGLRNPMSYYRETVFGLRHEPYIVVKRPAGVGVARRGAGHPWLGGLSSWTWPDQVGQPVTVSILSDADEVELVVNGAVVGRQAAGADRQYQAVFETTYEPGEVVAIAYRDGNEVARTTLVSAAGPVHADVRADRSTIRADDTDLAYVTIHLVDGAGTLVPDWTRSATVAVEGPGVLQGLGSGATENDESFCARTHRLHDGRVLAVVRPTGPGTITVTVDVDGCATEQITVDAIAPVDAS